MANTIIQRAPIDVGATTTYQTWTASSTPAATTPAAPAPAPTQPTIVYGDMQLSKFEFRKLFTLEERKAIDNLEYSGSASSEVKATVATFMEDLRVSDLVELDSDDVRNGVNYLVSVGIITADRATKILSKTAPQ